MQTLTIALPGHNIKNPSAKKHGPPQILDFLKRAVSYIFYSFFLLAALFAIGEDSALFSLTDDISRSRKKAMVVARYNEDLNWLKKIPWDYIVYNKGGDLPSWVKNEVKLQNVGREAHSYLTYIIDNYNNLPDHTIFVQGNPFDHSVELVKKIIDFKGKTDFFPLSDEILSDDGAGNPHHPGLKIAESAQKIYATKTESFEFPRGAQFIVSRSAILNHTKTTYQEIRNLLVKAEPSGKDFQEEDPGHKNLFSSWTLERLWKNIFDTGQKTIYD